MALSFFFLASNARLFCSYFDLKVALDNRACEDRSFEEEVTVKGSTFRGRRKGGAGRKIDRIVWLAKKESKARLPSRPLD
jgi:hypothetical protein